MTALSDANPSRGRKRPGITGVKKNTLRIDMTPMVDLGFLLITFFVITTELSKPSAMNLAMPKDQTLHPSELGESYALTILLDNHQHYYYTGSWEKALKENRIQPAGLAEIRQVILSRQQLLDDTLRYREGRKGLMLLIKASAGASYNSLVDVLDEVFINAVDKYALIRITEAEVQWLRQNQGPVKTEIQLKRVPENLQQ
jgi:biopolymer transport protein ExbD